MFNIVLQMNIEDGQRRVDPSCSRIDGVSPTVETV
jgi:hypothetical protein